MARKIIKLVPDGFSCSFADCPPGLFLFEDCVALKTEYGDDIFGEAFTQNGERFWGGVNTKAARNNLIVQPLAVEYGKEET
jgi:hypothetical protein